MAMFKKLIRFTGRHADIMQKYCREKGSEQDISFVVSNNTGEMKNIYIFDNRVHIYLVGGMLGIIYKKQSPIDKSTDTISSIMPEILDKQRQNLERMYHHMVLSEDNNLTADEKIKKAFSINKADEEWDSEQKRLENYVRGGLEIIDEIFSKCQSYEDICNSMFELAKMVKIDNPQEGEN